MTHAGIYIHIPFCRSRCSYCDFATGLYEGELAERYVNAVCSEIKNWREVDEPAPVDTIYFGGGTPSLLSPAQIERVLDAVNSRFALTAGAEITLEINPGDGGAGAAAEQPVDSAHPDAMPPHSKNQIFQDFRRLGITRASFGAQTFDDRELKQLGRSHDAKDIGRTFQQLRAAGFANINFDLIAGLPGQTPSDWRRNLKEALKLRPEHLSLYLLDVHEGTPLADQIERGMRPRPDADVAAEMYTTMVETVCTAGYEHYEISNFCLPRFESRHNTKYWSGAPYYGFGCSAHSFDGERRRWANERDVLKYVQLIEKTESPVAERTKLNDEEMRSESVFLGLRLMRGINLQTYRSRFDTDLHEACSGELQRLSEAGLIEINDRVLRLTTRGALLSNEVFAALA